MLILLGLSRWHCCYFPGISFGTITTPQVFERGSPLVYFSLSSNDFSFFLLAPRLKAARACGVSSKSISTWVGPLSSNRLLPAFGGFHI